MIKNVRHTGIVVKNLNQSLAFYCDLLGFDVFKRDNECGTFISTILGIKNLEVTTVKLKSKDGQMIELLDFHQNKGLMNDKELNDSGLTHISFTVSNLSVLYDKLVAAGIVFVSKPQVSPDKYAMVAFCKSPEGIYLELVELL